MLVLFFLVSPRRGGPALARPDADSSPRRRRSHPMALNPAGVAEEAELRVSPP